MYGVSDSLNGVFVTFESYSEAEQEIDELVSQHLEEYKEFIRLGIELVKDGGSCFDDIRQYVYRAIDGEDLALLAEEAIRGVLRY